MKIPHQQTRPGFASVVLAWGGRLGAGEKVRPHHSYHTQHGGKVTRRCLSTCGRREKGIGGFVCGVPHKESPLPSAL